MASTVRAYGLKGSAIAFGTAAVAGLVHGVLTGASGVIALEILFALVAATALAMGATTAARATRIGAVGMAVGMAVVFFWLRWSAFSAMLPEAGPAFAATPPWSWPDAMMAYVTSGALTGHVLWIAEAAMMFTAALAGALLGHEPRD